MNTYRYEIRKMDESLSMERGIFRVTEADGPSAPATGEYRTRREAEEAIEAVAGKPLDFEAGESEGVKYWVVEFTK